MLKTKSHIVALVFLTGYLFCFPNAGHAGFSFAVTSDQRQFAGPGESDNSTYFAGALAALKTIGAGAFMVSPGDIDPPASSNWTIENILGSNYQWFPLVGNHELPGRGVESSYGENLAWLRAFNYDRNGAGTGPDIVRQGPSGCPETTFSFDFANAHFVILNEYCDETGDAVTDGDIPNHLYDWLANDLALTAKQHIFVFGHEPAFPQPDADNGRARHLGDSLNQHPVNRDRFWTLLKNRGVVAYFCGHTHNYSVVNIGGVWQLDSGHARGMGDTGAPSTFLKVRVDGEKVQFAAYRDIHDNNYDYNDIIHTGTLKGGVKPLSIVPLLHLLWREQQ